jgi:multicomponent Na+:H+ antiporter subunit E
VLLANVLLALAWAALRGDFSLPSLIAGYLLGWAILAFLGKGGVLPSRVGAKVVHFFGLAGFFLWELVVANVRVALDVMRHEHAIRPAVVAIPLDATSDGEILLLSALINITPGSVTIDVSDDRRTLYVHVMHVESVEATRRDIKDGYERRVLQLLR